MSSTSVSLRLVSLILGLTVFCFQALAGAGPGIVEPKASFGQERTAEFERFLESVPVAQLKTVLHLSSGVSISPDPAHRGRTVTVTYDKADGPLAAASQIFAHIGYDDWTTVVGPDPGMTAGAGTTFSYSFIVPAGTDELNFAFNDGAGNWDSNGSDNWNFDVTDPPPGPALEVSTNQVQVGALVGNNPAPVTFTISNTGDGVLDFEITGDAFEFSAASIKSAILSPSGTPDGEDANDDGTVDAADLVRVLTDDGGLDWIQVHPTEGSVTTEPGTIQLTFNADELAEGTYAANLTVTANGANSPQTVQVVLNVGTEAPAETSVVPSPPVAGQSARVWYIATGGPLDEASAIVLHWGINGGLVSGGSWEQVTDTPMSLSGTAGAWFADIAIPAGASSLNFVVNDGNNNWDNNGGQDWNFEVVASSDPLIGLSRSQVATTIVEGNNADEETFTVRNTGAGTLDYTIALNDIGDGTDWLDVAPGSGSSTGEQDTVTVSFDAETLAVGSYSAEIEVSGNAANSPQTVDVRLNVTTESAQTPITIGPGPIIGSNTEGTSYNEEFQDWNAGDLRALDLADDASDLGDGYKGSRDIVAFYSRLENGNLFLRIDLLELGIFAENGNADVYVLIDCASGGTTSLPNGISGSTTRQWDIAVASYDAENNAVITSSGDTVPGAHLGSYWRSDLDSVEFGVTQAALTNAGWDGESTLYFNVITSKDQTSNLTDSIDLGTGLSSEGTTGRAKFAIVAHGNQSLNRGDSMRDRLYISSAGTGVGAPSGFRLTLDTHLIFQVPINIHMSSTLIAAIHWIQDGDPARDGQAFIDDVGRIVDANQAEDPGALIGGVFSEHIMPFFNGAVNQSSIEHFDAMTDELWGLSGDDMKVMHIPERVTNSVASGNGLDPFDDIVASEYTATYIDEVAHIRDWLYPGDDWTGIGGVYGVPRQHKIHLINGVYCFLINDMEDQYKFWPQDDGANQNWRYNLLYKAMDTDQEQLTLIFDDWEALAGYSFGSGYNNNAIQYNTVMRWVANHPWIEVITLQEILERATNASHPQYSANWIVDQGDIGDKEFNTYDYLHHATEDSYENWYYGSAIEESFRNAVPVLDGSVGSGTAIPSGKVFGELGTPGTIIEDTWSAIAGMSEGNLKDLAEKAYNAMIYETAWHDEDNTNYERNPGTNYTTWLYPDTTYDRVSGWAFTLHNHIRGIGITVEAGAWADAVRAGTWTPAVQAWSEDLDQDGQDEYVLANGRMFLAFERRGGRCVQAYAYDSGTQDAYSILGTSPINNPSAQGEEEYTSTASRCSAFKEMNDNAYSDDLYTASVGTGTLTFTSSNGQVTKIFEFTDAAELTVNYTNNTGGDLYTRLGVSVNNLDLLHNGQNMTSTYTGTDAFTQTNATIGGLTITAGVNAAVNELDTYTKFIIPLTEQVEVRLGTGASSFVVSVD